MKLNSRSQGRGWISDSKAMRTCASHDNATHSCPTHETCTHVPYVVTCTCAPTYDSHKHMYLCMTKHTHTCLTCDKATHMTSCRTKPGQTYPTYDKATRTRAPLKQSSSAPSQLRHSSWHHFAIPRGKSMLPQASRSSAGFPEGAAGELGKGLPPGQCSARPHPAVPTQGPRPSPAL